MSKRASRSVSNARHRIRRPVLSRSLNRTPGPRAVAVATAHAAVQTSCRYAASPRVILPGVKRVRTAAGETGVEEVGGRCGPSMAAGAGASGRRVRPPIARDAKGAILVRATDRGRAPRHGVAAAMATLPFRSRVLRRARVRGPGRRGAARVGGGVPARHLGALMARKE